MRNTVNERRNTNGEWVENIFNLVLFKGIQTRTITGEWKGSHRLPVV